MPSGLRIIFLWFGTLSISLGLPVSASPVVVPPLLQLSFTSLRISQVDPLENDLLFERFLNPERRDIPDIDLDFDSRRRDEVLDYVLAKTSWGSPRSIRWKMISFERFLNPERRDIPDIDLDFDSRRRDEVLDYVLAKYGQEMSCMVATVPTLEARSAVRELARVKGLSYEAIGKLTAYLPYIPGSQLRRALELLPELDASALKEKRYARLLEFARPHDRSKF